MSRIIENLIGRKCDIETRDGDYEENCIITDADDNWIKLEIPVKKGDSETKIFRADYINTIEITD